MIETVLLVLMTACALVGTVSIVMLLRVALAQSSQRKSKKSYVLCTWCNRWFGSVDTTHREGDLAFCDTCYQKQILHET